MERRLRFAPFSVKDPNQKGHDKVEVQGVELSSDGKTVTLKIDGLHAVNQMFIRSSVQSVTGQAVPGEIYLTINAVE